VISGDSIRHDIDNLRGDIGRDIYFYVNSQSPCSLCTASGYHDTATDTSFYITCPICKGAYYTLAATVTTVNARIRWTNDEAITATPAGKYYAGDATAHIEPEYLSLAESAQLESGKVVVDGHNMRINKIIPLGTITTNRIRLILVNSGERPTP
jgi:hypothetical protein